jgi:peptidoglycan/LPS O-acetylase OafA/YrhL
MRASPASTVYLPSLDGLRFAAFLLVFFHHFPKMPGPVFEALSTRGWIGVEIFFAVSAFLFFRLFAAEHAAKGTIDIVDFFIRRALRLHPLMVAFPVLMMIVFGAMDREAVAHLLAIAALVENFIVSVAGYDDAIPYTAHLWTISYEFQVYALMPLGFLVFMATGTRRFLLLLGIVLALALAARGAYVLLNAPHPMIWVLPFLRPESTLAGIVLAIGVVPRLSHPLAALALVIAAGAILLALPNVDQIGWSTMLIYPAAACCAAGAVALAAGNSVVSNCLSFPPLVALGRISYGLYVFHLLAIGLTLKMIGSQSQAVQFAVALLLTIVLAAASYFLLERPFLRWKRRFTVVESAPV